MAISFYANFQLKYLKKILIIVFFSVSKDDNLFYSVHIIRNKIYLLLQDILCVNCNVKINGHIGFWKQKENNSIDTFFLKIKHFNSHNSYVCLIFMQSELSPTTNE